MTLSQVGRFELMRAILPREPLLAVHMPDGASEHYKIAASEPGWNGSLMLTITLGKISSTWAHTRPQ